MSNRIDCAGELRKVGQGCFYTATIEPERGEAFTVVYDCGSATRGGALAAEIEVFQRSLGERGLNMLVLSHYDADHVNGLDLLLRGVARTETVFLPYFTPVERLICALRFPNEDDGNYYTFLADPVTFLLERGVQTIVFIGPGEEGEEEEAQQPPEPPRGGEEARVMPKIDLESLATDAKSEDSARQAEPSLIKRGAVMWKTDSRFLRLDWCWKFRFFHKEESLRDEIGRLVAKPKPREVGETAPVALRAARFLDAVESAVRARGGFPSFPLRASAIVDLIRSEDGRQAIKAAYGRITSVHNDVSLVMWHGPVRFSGWDYRSAVFVADGAPMWGHRRGRWYYPGHERSSSGTMLTGDLNIKARRTKDDFIRHYAASFPDTAFFYLPHHGSHEKWKADSVILQAHPACVASAGLRNQYGHPHLDVIDELEDEFGLGVFWSHERTSVILKTRCTI